MVVFRRQIRKYVRALKFVTVTLVFGTLSTLVSATAAMAQLVVTNTNDSGTGSLRAAIDAANASPSEDAITFNIPGAGPHTISLASDLPAITDDGISIDGTTQSGAACGDLWAGGGHTLLVRIGAVTNGDGLTVQGDNVTIKGLSITDGEIGIVSDPGVSGLTVQCNYIGIAPDGSAAGQVDGLGRGLRIRQNTNMTLGGPSGTDGNVIGASNDAGVIFWQGGTNLSVQNNFIGTDPTGTVARANAVDGLQFLGGGTFTVTEISDNLISGNGADGVSVKFGATLTGVSGDVLIQANHIGADRDGNTALSNGNAGVNIFADSALTEATIGGTGAGDGNVISANGNYGMYLAGTTDTVTILGNYVGVGTDGLTDLGNTNDGIRLLNTTTDVSIGNGAPSGRNIVSGNSGDGIEVFGGSTNTTIRGNYIGLAADGSIIRRNNVRGLVLRANASTGGQNNALVDGNVISGNGAGIDITSAAIGTLGASSTINITNNLIGVAADGTTARGNTGNGIKNTNVPGTILIGSDGNGNIIAHNGADGVIVESVAGTTAAILANSIHTNTGVGIDLESTPGVTANDSGDGDTGPNNLLNYPVINSLTAYGTTAIDYDINLDVPSDANGYRIDFYKNSVFETHGEGEIHLGFVDVAHAGGDLNFTGSLTANAAVSDGDFISATTTRKTGPSSHDITSEFAETKTASPPPSPLIVTNTNDSGAGSLRDAIIFANANPSEDAITFNIAGAGPHRITLTSNLPTISDDGVSIDGLTQTGASCGQLTAGTPHDLRVVIDGGGAATSDVFSVVADTTTIQGLSIVNSGRMAIFYASGASNSTAECLYLGMEVDGVTANSTNKEDGFAAINIVDADNTTIKNNLISGNDANTFVDGIRIADNSSAITITGNIIGLDETGTMVRANADRGIIIANASNNITIGGLTENTRNVISGNGVDGVRFRNTTSDISLLGNYIGLSRDGSTGLGNGRNGISAEDDSSNIRVGDGSSAGANRISANDFDGVSVGTDAEAAILANSIYSNTGLGIDLEGASGVTPNDSDDGDSGPNDLLNFPVINSLTAYGTTAIDYDINLDVPSDANGYRIDFYKNSVFETHGEGEIHLGFVDVAHAGGDLNFTGSLTANAAVSDGDFISATTTRKTGASSYDITSEFSLTATADGDASLTASETLSPLIAGDYMLPGKDVIYSYLVTNEGVGSVSTDSIVLITAVPAQTTFFMGDHDGPGPSADVIGFEETATTLTFDPNTDAQFSNASTKPSTLAGCTYTPAAGYDPNVTFICLNPKGAMAGGTPAPHFSISFRTRIK